MFEANSEKAVFPLTWLLTDLAVAQAVCFKQLSSWTLYCL